MCLWLLSACLGLLPNNNAPSTSVVVVGVPSPILTVTTTAASTTNMTLPPGPPPTNMTGPSGPPPTNMTSPPPPPSTGQTGSLPIDPRLGTTPSSLAALQLPPITGYSAQIPSYNTAVKFPRQRRSVQIDNKLENILKSLPNESNHMIRKRQSCVCVTAGTCNTGGSNSGAGLIDFRIVTPGGNGGQCPVGQEYCCNGNTGGQQIACGTLQSVLSNNTYPGTGQASFGEFPWQALILTKQNDYIAGGVLVNQLNVLTVTHRIKSYVVSGTAPNVKVRLGEWDAAGTYEPIPYQEYTVQRVTSHPSFNPNTLQYDITILRLSTSVPLKPSPGAAATINTACLPRSSTNSYDGQRCWVSGWGKDMFGVRGQYQQILKKVDVPIVDSNTCQSQMRTARLGPTFVLDTTSFICAGGEANKDSCTGDGGSGLVCQVKGQWVVVGLVSWGLGCASPNVPAAYVNVADLLPWIQQQIATS